MTRETRAIRTLTSQPVTCPFCISANVELTPRHSHSAAICECRSCREPFFVPIERGAMTAPVQTRLAAA
jgi:hypothetical protein